MKKGISLIVLVITIIVIIILAGAVILSLSNNNPIAQATEASFKESLTAYSSELNMIISSKYVQDFSFNPKTFYAPSWDGVSATNGTIKEYIPSITVADAKNYIIQQGKLVYIGSDTLSKQWTNELGASDPYVKSGLVMWYEGSDFKNSPQTVNWIDRSGKGNNAVATWFGYTPTSGSDGKDGIAFDGINDYLVCNTLNNTKTFKQLTYEVSFYTNPNINSNYKTLLGINRQVKAEIQTSGFLWFYDDSAQIGTTDGSWPTYDFTYPLKKNHMLLTLDTEANVAKFYLNGTLVVTDTTKDYADIKIGNNGIQIGTYEPGSLGHAYLGNIYTMRMYDRILTDAEIQQNYNATK